MQKLDSIKSEQLTRPFEVLVSQEILHICKVHLFKVKDLVFCKVSVTVELKSWRQIYLNSYFRIPSVYWEIIKCVGERLDILCQNIVKIHTILYQTLQTKQLCLRSSLSYFIIPTRLILNLEFHFEWNSRKMFFSECTTIFRALFWLLRLSDSLLSFK